MPHLPPIGFGLGAFGLTPFGIPPEPFAAEPPTVLVSSRTIDLVGGGYALDSDGNFLSMDDVGQRIVLGVRAAAMPELQIVGFEEHARAEILRVLDPVIGGSNPDATVLGSDVTISLRPNGFEIQIVYVNNLVGSKTSVTILR
jgi:hypothetical protein